MQIVQVKVILWAQDMSRAVAFWRDVIGLTLRFESEHWTEFAHGDATVALHGGGDGSFRLSGFGVQVADLDSACEELVAGGGTIRNGPIDRPQERLRIADVTDTEGNGFGLSQYDG